MRFVLALLLSSGLCQDVTLQTQLVVSGSQQDQQTSSNAQSWRRRDRQVGASYGGRTAGAVPAAHFSATVINGGSVGGSWGGYLGGAVLPPSFPPPLLNASGKPFGGPRAGPFGGPRGGPLPFPPLLNASGPFGPRGPPPPFQLSNASGAHGGVHPPLSGPPPPFGGPLPPFGDRNSTRLPRGPPPPLSLVAGNSASASSPASSYPRSSSPRSRSALPATNAVLSDSAISTYTSSETRREASWDASQAATGKAARRHSNDNDDDDDNSNRSHTGRRHRGPPPPEAKSKGRDQDDNERSGKRGKSRVGGKTRSRDQAADGSNTFVPSTVAPASTSLAASPAATNPDVSEAPVVDLYETDAPASS